MEKRRQNPLPLEVLQLVTAPIIVPSDEEMEQELSDEEMEQEISEETVCLELETYLKI